MVVPPIWRDENPRDERERQEIVARNVRGNQRRAIALIVAGIALIALMAPALLVGLPGLGLILVPTGIFMVIGGGIQLLFEKG